MSTVHSIVEQFVTRRRNDARKLVEGHNKHDPRSIERIRDIYFQASERLLRGASASAVEARKKARELLGALDDAGLSCTECAPESACELEERS